jgi:uncharacterized protein
LIVYDTTFLFALLDDRDQCHERAVSWLREADEEGAVTPLVLGEVDYLTGSRLGRHARSAFRQDVAAGAYAVSWWPRAHIETVRIAERYGELGVSLTDASLVALAARQGTTAVATFDERHFRAMRPISHGTAFTLLPADA